MTGTERLLRHALLFIAWLTLVACAPPRSELPEPSQPDNDPLRGLPTGEEQLARLCARNLGDGVSRAFCANGGAPPSITSLAQLQALLGLDFKPGNLENGLGGNPAFVLIGNSSSLVARYTASINPRAVIFTPPHRRARVDSRGTPLPQDATCAQIEPISPLPALVALGFTRGEDFIELISKDPTANGTLNFFLFKFEHGCSARQGGCTPGELLTPEGESNFTGRYTLYQDVDIANTIFDCNQCHQPAGPGTPKILRMQELQNPWAHFFRNNRVEGKVLLDDYRAAHGEEETYAGIPGPVIFNPEPGETAGLAVNLKHSGGSDPAALQGLVENEGFCGLQDNEYLTITIQKEVAESNPRQPANNLPMGVSASWMALFKNTVEGRAIPTSYHDVKVTDPGKLETLTAAYGEYRAGQRSSAELPDLRDVFLDAALPDLSFRPAPGLDGRGILVHMCQQCHNARLDQSLSRARFRVDQLDQMSRSERDVAIARLRLPASSSLHMPPVRFRELDERERDLAIAELERD